jgi:hypothetical protein
VTVDPHNIGYLATSGLLGDEWLASPPPAKPAKPAK